MSGFRIEKIEIDGFRGYSKPNKIDFNGKSMFITGGNFSGKSSTLGAIEWCLFGDFTSVPSNISTLRKRDEFVNDACREINVNLHLFNDQEKIIISRSKRRNVMESNLVFTDHDGKEYKDERAEEILFNHLGLTIHDFTRSVYLHQESIRYLLTEDPQERNAALDRLLGLDMLSDILDSIPKTKITKEIKDYSGDIERIKDALEARLRENNHNITDAKNLCLEAGLKVKDLDLGFANTLKDNIYDSLTNVAKEYKIPVDKASKLNKPDDLKKIIIQISNLIKDLRKKIFDNEQIEEINNKIRELDEAKGLHKNLLRKSNESSKKFNEFVGLNGNQEKISKNLKQLEEALEFLEKKREELGSRQKLFQDALTYFNEFSIEACPLCDSKIDQKTILNNLGEKVKIFVSKEMNEINKIIKENQANKSRLEKLLVSLGELEEAMKQTKKDLDDHFEFLIDLLEEKIDEKKNVEKIIEGRISALGIEKEKLTKPLAEKDAVITKIEEQTSQMKLIESYIRKIERQKSLEALQERSDFKKAEEVILKLSKLQSMINEITRCIQEVQVNSASGLINKVSDRINEIYNFIVQHPCYSELRIDVQPSLRRNKNNYFIKGLNDKKDVETLVAERFSTGHMNCVALAIYLAMAEGGTLNHNLDFLILDDPSQNLDKIHMNNLAKILTRLSEKFQIILSSQDPAFSPMIINQKCMPVLEFGPWDRTKGPSITIDN